MYIREPYSLVTGRIIGIIGNKETGRSIFKRDNHYKTELTKNKCTRKPSSYIP